jgi:hypothetical protein
MEVQETGGANTSEIHGGSKAKPPYELGGTTIFFDPQTEECTRLHKSRNISVERSKLKSDMGVLSNCFLLA